MTEISKECPIESKICGLLGNVLVTPYNVGPLILTIALWFLSCYFSFWNNNFDMRSTVASYIIWGSLGCILIGALSTENRSQYLVKFGVLTELITIFALVSTKSVIILVNDVGMWGLFPLSIFCFLLLLKNIWIWNSLREDK